HPGAGRHRAGRRDRLARHLGRVAGVAEGIRSAGVAPSATTSKKPKIICGKIHRELTRVGTVISVTSNPRHSNSPGPWDARDEQQDQPASPPAPPEGGGQ